MNCWSEASIGKEFVQNENEGGKKGARQKMSWLAGARVGSVNGRH